MRIVIASIVFPHPERGVFPGIERLLEGYVAALARAGHDVRVMTSYWNGGRSHDEWNGVPIERFSDSGTTWGKAGRFLDAHYFTWSKRVSRSIIERRDEIDVIHCVSPLADAGKLVRAGLPVVSSFYHYDILREARQLLYLPVHHAIERRAYRASDRVVGIWEHGGREVTQRFGLDPAKVRVVPLGVPAPADPVVLERAGSSLLYVGNLEKRKGLDVLLHSLAQLPENVTLDIVGHGVEEMAMRSLARSLGIESRAHFLGFVGEKELDSLYRTSALFVFPSLQVAGFVLWEAMARGCPVVATRVGGTPEIVGEAAVLVEPGDAGGLAQAIRGLLDSPANALALARRALEVPRRYTWEATVRNMEAVYAEAIACHAAKVGAPSHR